MPELIVIEFYTRDERELDSPLFQKGVEKLSHAALAAVSLSPKLFQELHWLYTLTVLGYNYRDKVESCLF